MVSDWLKKMWYNFCEELILVNLSIKYPSVKILSEKIFVGKISVRKKFLSVKLRQKKYLSVKLRQKKYLSVKLR